MNGLSIEPGTKIPVMSYVTLVVGDGHEELEINESVEGDFNEDNITTGVYDTELL